MELRKNHESFVSEKSNIDGVSEIEESICRAFQMLTCAIITPRCYLLRVTVSIEHRIEFYHSLQLYYIFPSMEIVLRCF